jgi:hypothetical protein
MNRRGPFLVILAVGLACYVTYLRGYAGVLALTGDETAAEVIEYRAASDGGDWIMRYRFQSSGRSFDGSASFARKVRPPDDVSRVSVRYLSWAPSVSGVVGYISATGLVAYAMAAWTLWRGIRFWRDDATTKKA